MNRINRMTQIKEERSLGELFSELSQEMQRLVRDEVALAKSELSRKIALGVKDAVYIAAGGALIYAGVLAIVAAAVLLLGTAIAPWLSALIIGLLVLGGGYLLVQRGITAFKKMSMAPTRTISTLKEDKEWLKKTT